MARQPTRVAAGAESNRPDSAPLRRDKLAAIGVVPNGTQQAIPQLGATPTSEREEWEAAVDVALTGQFVNAFPKLTDFGSPD